MCSGSGFSCAPPLLARVLGPVCACVPAPLVPRHSWLGRVVWVRVLRRGFWLRPATPGWGVGVCVCLRARSACTPPLLAWVCGVGVCAWARVWAVPCHFWLRCWGVCVCVPALLVARHSLLGCAACVCVIGLGLRLRPATPGWGVGCVCACMRAPLVPRHSWLGCAVCECVLWLGFQLCPTSSGPAVGMCVLVCALCWYSATPGWVVRCGCVCLRSGFGCAPPFLAWGLGCVCVRVRAPLVPRHSWLGCMVVVRVHGLGFWLRPATPGSGVGVCVCLCARYACTPPLLAGVCGAGVGAWARASAAPRHSWLGCWGVCVFFSALRLYPATPGLGVWCGYVCLSSGFGCAPPLQAGGLGCVCACVRALLVPCSSWLQCAVWVCVLVLGFWLRPASPGWRVRMCVCLCARSVFTPPLLAGVCSVGVCAWARVSAAPRHSWLGCWGVCVFVCALRLYSATPGLSVWCWYLCLGSGFSCAPPLLAGGFGCMCACVRAPLVP